MKLKGKKKICLATSGFGFENEIKKPNKSKFSNKVIPSGMELLNSTQNKQTKEQQCLYCNKFHLSTNCKGFINLCYDKAKNILIRRELVLNV